MLLIVFGALGLALGYRCGIGKGGFVALGIASLSSSTVQILHVAMTTDPARRTLLPLVVGVVVVVALMTGALLRKTSTPSSAA